MKLKNTDLYTLAEKSYYGKKENLGNSYNYDLYPLIKDFTFTEFLSTNTKTEHGAVLVITNNQYIIGYTSDYGLGSHRSALARIIKTIHGGNRIQDSKEAKRLEDACKKQYITARIIYDHRGDDEEGIPIYSGAIYFQLPQNDTITKEQFELFKKFYNEYNEEIKMLIRKYGQHNFKIQYGHIDKTGTKEIKNINSLDEIYTYLETRINYDKEIANFEEIIIGTPINDSYQKIKKK